jgi:hypothetical protein
MANDNAQDNTWNSLYIPSIPADLAMIDGQSQIHDLSTEEAIENVLRNQINFGEVARIDFVTIPNRFNNKIERSAFVHFTKLNDGVRETINTQKKMQLMQYSFNGLNYTFISMHNTDVKRYITFMRNYKPISRVIEKEFETMNIPQLVDKIRELRQTIDAQTNKMNEMVKTIEYQTKQISEMTVQLTDYNEYYNR